MLLASATMNLDTAHDSAFTTECVRMISLKKETNSDHPGLCLLLGNNWIHDNHTVRDTPNLWLDT